MNKFNQYRFFIGLILVLLAISLIFFAAFNKTTSSTSDLLIIIAGMSVVAGLVAFQKIIEDDPEISYSHELKSSVQTIVSQVNTDNNNQMFYESNSRMLADEKIINIIKKEEPLGLIEAIIDSNSYDYSSLILDSQYLQVVLNDGRGWVSRHIGDLKRRFEDPSKKTEFFFIHPSSSFISTLARKVISDEESLREKILYTVEILKETCSSETNLKIYGHFLYNPYSLYVGDKYAIMTPYFYSRIRRTIPLFQFQDRIDDYCYYKVLKGDIEDLKRDSEIIISCPKTIEVLKD